MSDGRPTRRVLLAGALGAVGGLAACSRRPAARAPAAAIETSALATAAATAPSPDRQVAEWVAAGEQEMLAMYAGTLAAHPQLRPLLEPVAAEHEQHLAAIKAALASPSSPSTPSPAATGSGRKLSPAAAVRQLSRAESAAATDRLADVLTADDAGLARLLASVGAAEAAHAALLGGTR